MRPCCSTRKCRRNARLPLSLSLPLFLFLSFSLALQVMITLCLPLTNAVSQSQSLPRHFEPWQQSTSTSLPRVSCDEDRLPLSVLQAENWGGLNGLTSMRKSRTKGACDAQSARKMRQINPYTSHSLTVCVKVCGGVCAAMCIAPIRGTIRIGLSAVPKLLVQVFNDFFKGHKVSILPENIATILSKFVAQVQEFFSIPIRQLVGFAANSFQLFTFTSQSCQFFKCFIYFLYIYIFYKFY